MISSIRVRGFKGHRDSHVALAPMTVIAGPNGSGKSSLLQAIQLLSVLPTAGYREAFVGGWICSLGTDSALGLAIDLTGRTVDDPWRLSLSVQDRSDHPNDQQVRVSWNWRGDHAIGSGLGMMDEVLFRTTPVSTELGRIASFTFDAAQIAAPAKLTETRASVGPHGASTAAALALLKIADAEALNRITAVVQRIVPSVEQIHVTPTQMNGSGVGFEVTFDFKGVSGVPARMASSGTLITLALITALHGPDAPSVVLLDEIDHSLHPKAQAELVSQLRELVKLRGDLQIIATTHSPYVLDAFEHDEVRVLAQRPDGSVAVKNLTDHPDAARLCTTLSPGQLWSLDDEATWVVKTPAPCEEAHPA